MSVFGDDDHDDDETDGCFGILVGFVVLAFIVLCVICAVLLMAYVA